VRILFVKPGDGFELVNVFCWLPVGLIEAGPFDKVLESSPMHPGIENGIHKPLLFAIDFYRGWRGLSLSGDGILRGWFQ
jgi:hypothetical protein